MIFYVNATYGINGRVPATTRENGKAKSQEYIYTRVSPPKSGLNEWDGPYNNRYGWKRMNG
jgi:hypothetical protein